MSSEYQIDDLDRQILRELTKDARVAFVEIADKLKVSGGTVHQRVNKMRLGGVLGGFQPILNRAKLGFGVSALIGIHLKNAKDCAKVIDRLRQMPEITEAHYTTGSYALVVKVSTKDIESFHSFLMEELQKVTEIQSTESFITLSTPIERPVRI